MAKRSLQKGLRSRETLSADPWFDDGFGLLERQSQIEVDAPVGTYDVDHVVLRMMQNGDILPDRSDVDHVREARIIVDISGAYANRRANEEQSAPSKYENAKRAIELLSTMRDAGRIVRRTVVEDLAGAIARADDVVSFEDDTITAAESYKVATEAAQSLIDKVAALTGDLERFLDRYPIDRRTGSSSEPLTNWFIFYCVSGWHGLTGKWPKKNNCADLRRFLAAGWADLKLPQPVDRQGEVKPLDDHFRDRLAKSDVFEGFRGN